MSLKRPNSSYIVHFFVFPFSCIKNFRIFSLLGNCNSYRATNSWGEWGKSIILDDSPVSPAFRRAPSRATPRAPCSTPVETPGPVPPCRCWIACSLSYSPISWFVGTKLVFFHHKSYLFVIPQPCFKLHQLINKRRKRWLCGNFHLIIIISLSPNPLCANMFSIIDNCLASLI